MCLGPSAQPSPAPCSQCPETPLAEAVRSGEHPGWRAPAAGWGPRDAGNHAPRGTLVRVWAGVQPAGGRVCARTVGTDAEATGRSRAGLGLAWPRRGPLTCPGSRFLPAEQVHTLTPRVPPCTRGWSRKSGECGGPAAPQGRGHGRRTGQHPHPTGGDSDSRGPHPARISPLAQRLQAARGSCPGLFLDGTR